jgi:hypothetical protein
MARGHRLADPGSSGFRLLDYFSAQNQRRVANSSPVYQMFALRRDFATPQVNLASTDATSAQGSKAERLAASIFRLDYSQEMG